MKSLFLAITLCLFCVSCADKGAPDTNDTDERFMKGSTASFISYLEGNGLSYRENGKVADPYSMLKAHGANVVRLQVDFEPFADFGDASIDWQSLERVKADAQRAVAAGLDVILTIKSDRNIYSAGETVVNLVPTVWLPLADDVDALGRELRKSVLQTIERIGVVPIVVAVGNEVNLNFIGVEGAAWNGARIARLLQYGFSGVADYNIKHGSNILCALHMASPSSVDALVPQFIRDGAVGFDIIALSWYDGMSGHSMGAYKNFADMSRSFKSNYGRRMMILETARSFTKGYGDNCTNAYYSPSWGSADSEFSPAKQRAWLRHLAEDVKAGGGVGVITWGTESLPSDDVWMYPAAWAHGSTWENNSYWDFLADNNLHEGIDWMLDIE